MDKNRLLSLLAMAGLALAALPARADTCQTTPGNLVANCGFENGTYSSTIGGNTNNLVPVNWAPNAGFDLEPGFNHVTAAPVFQGSFALSIGNFDFEPVPSLSQTLSDTAGNLASGSIYVDYGGCCGDAGAFFDVLVNNVPVLTLSGLTTPNSYNQYTFNFTTTGSDLLTIEGNTNPSEWFADNITVTAAASASVPEPGTVVLLGSVLLAVLPAFRRASRVTSSGVRVK